MEKLCGWRLFLKFDTQNNDVSLSLTHTHTHIDAEFNSNNDGL